MKIRYRYWACQLARLGPLLLLTSGTISGRATALPSRTDVFGDTDFYSAWFIALLSTPPAVPVPAQTSSRKCFYWLGAVFMKVWGAVTLSSLLIVLWLSGISIAEDGGWYNFSAPQTSR